TSAIQLCLRRLRRACSFSPSKVAGARRSSAGSTFSNALTLTTAKRRPSIRLVTTGTTPHAVHTCNSAVFVPNAFFDTRTRSLTLTVSDPVGQEVQTPPCFAQNEQVQARAGISDGSGCQSSANEILPQWQRPEINMALPQQPARKQEPRHRTSLQRRAHDHRPRPAGEDGIGRPQE